MFPTLRTPVALALALLLALLSPGGHAAFGSNDAAVRAEGDGAAAAVCQVVVLVRSLLIVGEEDGLGLAIGERGEPVVLSVPETSVAEAPLAECDVAIERLRIVYGDGGEEGGRGNYVSGPPGIAMDGPEAPFTENRLRLDVDGGASVAVCQLIVLVDSMVLGGGAAGLSPGLHPPVLRFWSASSEGDAARCRTAVGDVEFA